MLTESSAGQVGRRRLRGTAIGSLLVAGILILGAPRDVHAWGLFGFGVYDDQGNWNPNVPPIWPASVLGEHWISVCWEAPDQATLDRFYPPTSPALHTHIAASRTEAEAWARQARHNIENTWGRAANLNFTGWGPCSYSLYDEYPNTANFDLVLLENGQRVHPERHGIHMEFIHSGTSFGAQYRGRNGIVLNRMALHSDIEPPWQEIHEFGHILGFIHEHDRSDFCNEYVPEGGDLTCQGVPLPQPSESGPQFSPTPNPRSVMSYFRAPPHQFYFGSGRPFKAWTAEMGVMLSPLDVSSVQAFYGRPPAGSIKGYRGRMLLDPDGVIGNGVPVLASYARLPQVALWSTELLEGSLSPRHEAAALDLQSFGGAANTPLTVNATSSGAQPTPAVRLARWRAWGNMCLWAQSATEEASIVLDYCIPTLDNPGKRLYWIEHLLPGNSFQYQLADTNLCASVPYATYPSGPLVLRTCDIGDDRQLFMKNDVGQWVPRAIAAASRDKCLNVLGPAPRPGNALGLWPCVLGVPGDNTQFFLTAQLQFSNSEQCMEMLTADTTLDASGGSWAPVVANRCLGATQAFAYDNSQAWDIYGGGSLTPAARPTLGAGSSPASLGTGLTDRMRKDFTIEIWVNPDASQATYANIIDFNHRTNIGIVIQQDGTNTNQYGFGMGNGDTSCGLTHQLQANRWQHLQLVRNGTALKLFVDGVQVSSSTCFAQDIYFLPDSAVTVAYNANYGRAFSGRYAGVRLWNQAREPMARDVGDPDATLAFDGSSDGLRLEGLSTDVIKGDFTIEMLVNPASTQQTYANILDANHRANVGLVIQQNINTTNSYLFAVGNGSTSAGVSAQLAADRWQSVIFMRSDGQLSLYIDGSLVSQASGFSGDIYYLPNSKVTVGYNANYGRYFNGQVKVVQISSAAKLL